MNIILTIILALLLQLFLPWWSVSIAAGIIALIFDEKLFRAFIHGFLSIALLWLVWSIYIYFNGGEILVNKLSGLLSLPFDSLIILITSLIGGIVGGLGAVTGAALKKNLLSVKEN